MNQYFFVLGTNHSLCKVDIINTLLKTDPDFKILEASQEVLIIETNYKLNTKKLIGNLGSAIKIGLVFKKYDLSSLAHQIGKETKNKLFLNFFTIKADRFAVSVYDGGAGFKSLNKTFFESLKISKILKKKLSLKFLSTKTRKIASFLVDKSNLLNDGFELVLVSGKNGIYLGKTEAIQDYKGYSLRDYGRPQRDSRSGMISPKLAKIMINLAEKDKDMAFLDPFCGSGTFLQELILLGFKNIIGSDIEQKSIDSTNQNLNWLFENFPVDKKNYKINTFKSDVLNLSNRLASNSIDAIVTEPFLGSSKSKYFSLPEIKGEIEKLSKLYIDAFSQFKIVLKNDGVIVIILPVFKHKENFYQLEIINKIISLGFEKVEFINSKQKSVGLLKLNITKRGSIIFFHPGQTVSREIFVFEKIKKD